MLEAIFIVFLSVFSIIGMIATKVFIDNCIEEGRKDKRPVTPELAIEETLARYKQDADERTRLVLNRLRGSHFPGKVHHFDNHNPIKLGHPSVKEKPVTDIVISNLEVLGWNVKLIEDPDSRTEGLLVVSDKEICLDKA